MTAPASPTPTTQTRVAVVIGGASGIGAAVAARLRAEGLNVVVADVAPGPSKGDPAADDLAVDVSDEDSVSRLFDRVVSDHGRLDVVVNSAGVSTLGLIEELDVAEFRRVVDVNLTGGFLVLKHAGQRMGQGGSLVSLTSLNARQPGTGMAAYCAAKAGLAMLTEVAALEWGARGIRVNAVSPGLVITPLTAPALDIPGIEQDYLENMPLGRAGTVEDVANAVWFLCSGESTWMTGEVLDLNGGAHLQRYPDIYGHVMRSLS
ncbi:SDR family NAD(P)-dependent oxidoreductase [Nocardioides salsibiostraticola]